MSSRGRREACRICGGHLQGNQRRWLYAAQNRKGAQTQTHTDFPRKGSQPRSVQSSPWGSTVSLSSTRSLSKSDSPLTPLKEIDLLCVLTHILEETVPRGDGRGEFICGKCVSVLERVFKFDTVISRVKVLSGERLQRLTQERDKIRRWVCNVYHQQNSSCFRGKGSSSEDEGEPGRQHRNYSVGDGYREMLRDNMALAEYEWWAEKAESCPRYRRTGKRCHKDKKCECCDSLRVSDSDYESVCGVPRHLPEQAFTSLGLSRDESHSMPLHWSRVPSVRSSPASLPGSGHSLRSRTASVQSLDSLDGNDPFDWLEEQGVSLESVLKELREIEGRPVRSPAESRIPVLGRGEARNGRDEVGMNAGLVRVLNFGEQDNGTDDEFEEESEDVLTELRDEFMPLQCQASAGRVYPAVQQLREQLTQAQSHIRTLEAQLENADEPDSLRSNNKNDLMDNLSQSLHSRENVIQDCVTLIQRLCAEQGAESQESDGLIQKLSDAVSDKLSEYESALEAELSEVREREKALEKQVQAHRDAGRERDRDMMTLTTVLQCNQDVINHLRVELAERDGVQQQMMNEWKVWRERDSALTALLKDNNAFISQLKGALESSRRDVQALSVSLIGRGLEGGGTKTELVNQLQEKESLLTASLKDREEFGATLRQEISRLTTALKAAETIIQDQRESHRQAVTELSEQLRTAHEKLREKTKEKKEAELEQKKEIKEREIEEEKLIENLQKRDKLIEQVLLELEERDGVQTELQPAISGRMRPKRGLRRTL